MPRKAKQEKTDSKQPRFPAGFVPKPPVSLEDLKADTEYDPEGAEEFVALIRALRRADSRPTSL